MYDPHRWKEYWEHIAHSHAQGQGLSEPVAHRGVALLQQEGVLCARTNLLEIGAGAGAYTLELAAICRQITAIDMAPAMLSVLEDRCSSHGRTNVETVHASFEDFTPCQTYDVVFAAMCPAIGIGDSLRAFERLSSGYCALVTAAKGSHSQLRRALRQRLTQQPLEGLSVDVLAQYQELYQREKSPNIKIFPFEQQSTLPLEQAIARYQLYYSIWGLDTPEHQSIIREYLTQQAQEGFCIDTTIYNMAVLWWKP